MKGVAVWGHVLIPSKVATTNHLISLSILCSNQEVTETSLTALKEENKTLSNKVSELDTTVKKLNKELEEERERGAGIGEDGLTRIEVARVLRERNEFKEKYLSLLEQIRCVAYHRVCMCGGGVDHVCCNFKISLFISIRMSDELSLFKSKPKKSRWVD